MAPTPLQSLLGLSLLGPDERILAEGILAAAAATIGFALRGHRQTVGSAGLMMCALGLIFDIAGAPQSAQRELWGHGSAALGLVLVSWGAIKILLDAAGAAAHRSRAHFSTIFKDLLTILGFALQETLGNVFSGLTLQVGKPFEPGDWVRSGNFVGRVQGIGWRSTAVITRANERLEIPNAMLAKDVVVNYSNGVVADETSIGLSYSAPPNFVREVITETLRDVHGVLQSPPPEIYAWEYGESSIRYRVKYWLSDYADADRVREAVTTSLWYALRRKEIEIPFPIRTLRLQREKALTAETEAFEREIMGELRQVDFLRDLRDEELRLLLPGVTAQQFGRGEVIVREGDNGNSLYIVRSGTVEVLAAKDGKQVHMRDLARPAFFGEMALMTGEPRTATIRARTDAELLELSRDGFTELFKAHPETASQIGEVIALRNTERRELLASAPHGDGVYSRSTWLLAKMRSVFDLAGLR